MLGVVLVHFENFFGMPKKVLYPLAIIALIFCLYSVLCFSLVQQQWRPFLKVLAVANMLYCFVTIGLVFCFYAELTFVGVTYFVVEVLIIAILSAVEWRKAAQHTPLSET